MPPENNPSRFSSSKALFTVLVVILIGAGLGLYLSRWKKNNTLQQSNFSPQTQFVPKGAESREVDQVLLSFGLPTTPPFFDKKNAVQSLDLTAPTSSQTPPSSTKTNSPPGATTTSSVAQRSSTTFLSYRIFGQNKTGVRIAFTDYFKNLGWKTPQLLGNNDQAPITFFTEHQGITITLIEVPHAPGTDQPAIVAALTMQSINPSTR